MESDKKKTTTKKTSTTKKGTTKKSTSTKKSTTKKTSTAKKSTSTKKTSSAKKTTTKKTAPKKSIVQEQFDFESKDTITEVKVPARITKKEQAELVQEVIDESKTQLISDVNNQIDELIKVKEIKEASKDEVKVAVESVIKEVAKPSTKETKVKSKAELYTDCGILTVIIGLFILIITVYLSTSFDLSDVLANILIVVSFAVEAIGFISIIVGLFKSKKN